MSIANETGAGGERKGSRGPDPVRSPATRSVRTAAACALLAALPCAPAVACAQGAPDATSAPGRNPFTTEVAFGQFVQGPVTGGLDQEAEYGGKLEVELKIDTHKLGLWSGGVLAAKAATRYGELSTAAGAAIPVNTALVDPAEDGTETSLVALNFTQLFPFGRPGSALAVSVGRFSTLELVPDGTGLTGFMNVGQIAPTHEARNVPLVTLGGSVALVMGGEPVATLMIIDSRNSSLTSGLSDAFGDGVTVFPALTLPTRFFGRPGHQGIHGTWSSQELTPFDEIPHLILPRPDTTVSVERESGGWSVTYTGDQFIQESPGPHRTGWRLYWAVGLADESTNPIDRYFNVGVGGTSPFGGRELDSFGAAWAYTGFGGDFKDLVGRLIDIDDEQAFEVFYSLALTPWARLTGDLQVVRPFRSGVDTAVVPAARLLFLF